MEVVSEVMKNEGTFLIEKAKQTSGFSKGAEDKIKASLVKKEARSKKIEKALRAKKGSINWDGNEEAKEVRNTIITAFMANDTGPVLKLLKTENKIPVTIEVLKALEIAHGDYDRLERAATKAGKGNFIKTIYGFMNELVSTEEEEK